MLASFKQHIETNFSLLLESKLLIACSGGLDSVVLTHLCESLRLEYSLAHCNYRLRGAESDGDQEFVEGLASKLGRKVHAVSFDTNTYKKTNQSSIQLVARELRYNWFYSLLKKHDYKYVLTAHHADDNLETFIINLSRGTGLQGLTGIPEQNQKIIRPLMPFTRKELLDFALEEKLEWREDSSNSETKYLRNKIRLEIVPKLKELSKDFMANFKLGQKNLSGVSVLMENYKKDLQKELFKVDGKMVRIAIKKLESKHPLKEYLYLLFYEYGFAQPSEVKKLLNATSGKKIASHTHQLIKNRNELLLCKLEENPKEAYTIEKEETFLLQPFRMKIQSVAAISTNEPHSLFVDGEKLKFPLMLRKWNNGDYFYPLGMKGKKKVSKFYKDEKIDVLSKEKIWLLCSGDAIVWIVGKRADDRFKVTSDTKTILKFELS